MAKEYNIDDILSEVKKRRTENEEQLIKNDATQAQEDIAPQPQETVEEAIEEAIEETVEEVVEEPQQVDEIAEDFEQITAVQEEIVVPAEEQGAINIFDYADSYGITADAEYEEVEQEELGKTKKARAKS